MAARSGTVPWFDNFDVAAEVEILTAHIERWTEFALPARKRDVIMSFAKSKLETTRLAYREAKAAGKPVSTSRRAYLTDLQDTIFMPLSSSLNDMKVQDARAFVSKLWHGTIDDNARKYAEALKCPEREIMPLWPGSTV